MMEAYHLEGSSYCFPTPQSYRPIAHSIRKLIPPAHKCLTMQVAKGRASKKKSKGKFDLTFGVRCLLCLGLISPPALPFEYSLGDAMVRVLAEPMLDVVEPDFDISQAQA